MMRGRALGRQATDWRRSIYYRAKAACMSEVGAALEMTPSHDGPFDSLIQAEELLSYELAVAQILTGDGFEKILEHMLDGTHPGRRYNEALDSAAQLWVEENERKI